MTIQNSPQSPIETIAPITGNDPVTQQPTASVVNEQVATLEQPTRNNKNTAINATAVICLIIIGIGFVALRPFLPTTTMTESFPEDTPTENKVSNPSKISPTSSVVTANTLLTLDLYNTMRSEEGNLFFSPYSILSALAMTGEGAKGQTLDEMKAVLHLPVDMTAARIDFSNINSQLNVTNKPYTISVANALWAQKNFQFRKDYFSVVAQIYGGTVQNLDYISDAEGARKTINAWVESHTNEKIKNLIAEGILSPETRLVLTNAIYFKGAWIQAFNPEDTQDTDFRITPENVINVPMMQRTDENAKFMYGEDEFAQVLELPYSGDDLSMLLILPKEELGSVNPAITNDQLSKWRNSLSEQQVKVYLPRFKFEKKLELSTMLSALGMPTAFSDSADFTGMEDDLEDLKIDKVIHQAFVEVNEEGTEAAAATAVVVARITSFNPNEQPIPVFRADHPFIFIIQQKDSGNILFMGRVTNP